MINGPQVTVFTTYVTKSFRRCLVNNHVSIDLQEYIGLKFKNRFTYYGTANIFPSTKTPTTFFVTVGDNQ
jgi:hypothetical protein